MEDSEDIVQDVFYKIWKNRAQLDEFQSFVTYLFSAVKNSSLNLLDHKKHENKYAEIMAFLYLRQRQEDGMESIVVRILSMILVRRWNAFLWNAEKQRSC